MNTFEYNGRRMKNVSHKNLYFQTKDAPLVCRFGNFKEGNMEYGGPFIGLEVMGDTSGEYVYKPFKGADMVDDMALNDLKAICAATGGQFVKVTATFGANDTPTLVVEDEQGNPVLPGDQQWSPTPQNNQVVQQAAQGLDAAPVNQAAQQALQAQATGTPMQADQGKLKSCLILAGTLVDEFQQHLGRPMTEHDRTLAITLFIESNKR